MDRAVLEAYATETGDPTWTEVTIPPFTTPETAAEAALHQAFEELDGLCGPAGRR